MILSKNKTNKGFTLIEVMVVVVIFAILIAISVPNYLSAQERAKTANIKSNMQTVQTMVESYSVDWYGEVPQDMVALEKEAKKEGYVFSNDSEKATAIYWKSFNNPYATSSSDASRPRFVTVTNPVFDAKGNLSASQAPVGSVVYIPSTLSGKFVYYTIYGAEKKPGTLVIEDGRQYFLTNN